MDKYSPSSAHNTSADLVITGLFVLALAVWGVLNLVRRRRGWPVSRQTRTISQKRFIYLAFTQYFVPALTLTVFLLGCVASMHLGGRIHGPTAAGSYLVVMLFSAVICLPSLPVRLRILRMLKARKEINLPELLEEKVFSRFGNTWIYSDKTWFISIGRCCCAVVRRDWIDFSQPVQTRHLPYQWNNQQNEFEFVLTRKNGESWSAFMGQIACGQLIKWIHEHQGRMDSDPVRNRHMKKRR